MRLKKVIQSFAGAQIIGESDEYIKAKVASSFFGFVDDVEILYAKK
jgi:uncharacterized protein (DUF1499 family)